MICLKHNHEKKTHPCPWVYCENGVRSHTYTKGKSTYERVRIKDELGPRYEWRKLVKKIMAERPRTR